MVNIPNSHNRAQILIKSLARGDTISFFPYDFQFDDSYKPEWGTYETFGRMDPIMTYKRTTRDVNISFNVVAENSTMAKTNFKNLQNLIKCLYPTYTTPGSGVDSYIEKQQKLRQEKLNQVTEIEAQMKNMINEETQIEDPNTEQSLLTEEDIVGINLSSVNSEISKIEQDITQATTQQQDERKILSDFGIGVMHKSPLFQIAFMNLLRQEEHVIAITSFKHQMKFDAADTSFSKNGIAIPGEFNINLSFKVIHTNIPGEMLNYDK